MNSIQRLKALKKELKAVKKFLDINVEKTYNDYDKGNACYYKVITKEHKEYIIGRTTKEFPDINFKNIIYITKAIRTNGVIRDYDIYRGEFDIKTDYSYFKRINEHFKVIEIIATGPEY